MDAADLCYTPALELGRLYRAQEVSPVEATEAVLARIDRLNPTLNAFLTVTADHARQLARAAEARIQRGAPTGPMDGIPYSIKDLEPTAGIRTTFGSKFFEQNVPTEDGALATRLRASGGVLLGKTNTPHYGYKDMCDNLLGPPCKNPWKPPGPRAPRRAGRGPPPRPAGAPGPRLGRRGLIRIPSALCGIFGLKPSFGRIPYWPGRPLGRPLPPGADDPHRPRRCDAVGDGRARATAIRCPLTARFPTFRRWWKAISRACGSSGAPISGTRRLDPEVRRLTEAAAKRFVDFGATVEEANPVWDDPFEFHRVLYHVGIGTRIAERALEHPEWIEATMQVMLDDGARYSAFDYQQAILKRTLFYNQARAWFENIDLLLTPQMPVGAWSFEPGIGEGPKTIGGQTPRSMFDRLHFTYPFNYQPASCDGPVRLHV